jgi:hypothetical protein
MNNPAVNFNMNSIDGIIERGRGVLIHIRISIIKHNNILLKIIFKNQ